MDLRADERERDRERLVAGTTRVRTVGGESDRAAAMAEERANRKAHQQPFRRYQISARCRCNERGASLRPPRVLTHRKTIVYTRQDCTDRESLPRQRTAACRSADDRALRTIRALRPGLGASAKRSQWRDARSRLGRRCRGPAPRTWPARRQQAPRRRLGRACRIIHLSVLRTRSRSSVSGRSR